MCLWGSLHVCTRLHVCVFTWVGAFALTEGLCACGRVRWGTNGLSIPTALPQTVNTAPPRNESDGWYGGGGGWRV